MKKIFITCFCIFFIIIFSVQTYAAPCVDFAGEGDITQLVKDCVESEGQLTVRGDDLIVGDQTNAIINNFIRNLGVLLSIGAIIMIVYSGLLMTLSGGNDEKIKKGKDLLKWTLIGYIALLTAGGIVSFIISLIFSIASS